MKKIFFALLIIFMAAIPVSAQQSSQNYEKDIENLVSDYDVDFSELKEYPFETLWDTVKNTVKKSFSQPLTVFYRITSVLLLTSFINFFSFDADNQVSKVINIISMLVIFYSVFEPFSSMIKDISENLFDIKNFMVTFLPVFAGVSFAAGEMITSAVYTGFFLICVVSVANFCINYIVPSINIFLAIGITSSISSIINLKPLCEFYSKAVKAAMTAAVSVLCFVLSLQTTIAQGKDTLVLKAGKVFVTTTVPIIGSALEGAVGSVYASMGVLKSFCGLAGIAVILNIFLPAVIKLSSNWICYQLMIVISKMMENEIAGDILTCFRDVTEILLSMSVLFAVLLIFSLTIMIKTVGVV